jgi:hypothetical protein
MPGPSPKPDDQRRRRNPPTFAWVELPKSGREGSPPRLPAWRQWQPKTKRWWKELWAKPQAVMWEQDGSTLLTLACLYDDLIAGRADAAKVSAEMRQHEDRHGLNPKAMLQLRWLIRDESTEPGHEPAPVTPIDDRRKRLRVV